MKIAIDIGHANGTGARGNGLEEHALGAKIASHLFSQLIDAGHDPSIIDFPDDSNSDDLNKTISIANANNYDFGISIHLDAADVVSAHGAHVCFYPGSVRSARLASCVATPLCQLLPGRANAVVARANLAVLKKTRVPWVLAECGFITNPSDCEMATRHPGSIANAIAQGIQDFITKA